MQRGDAIGPYTLLRELGRGASSVVWLAEHEGLQVRRALKIHTRTSGVGVERMLREARVQATVSHPRVATVHDVLQHDGGPVIVQEFVEGMELHDLLAYRMSADRIERIVRDVLEGLCALHAGGIVHRDLKPSNVIVGPGGRACIVDLGIARKDGHTRHTRAGSMMGTPGFMAPEQAEDAATATFRSDLFSVGCLALTLLLGENPFARDTVRETLVAVYDAEEDLPHLLAHLPRAGATGRLCRLVEATVRRDPADRPASARALLEALEGERPPTTLVPAPPDRRVTLSPGALGILGAVSGAGLASVAVASFALAAAVLIVESRAEVGEVTSELVALEGAGTLERPERVEIAMRPDRTPRLPRWLRGVR
ncbi:MAG: serine/threonine protein kinase [Myxococcales bacterium]|nr:serine/threonine protein kinase [Myxococcales bacterium]